MSEKKDTGFKEVQVVSSLVVSYKNEIELEYYLNFIDKTGKVFFDRLKDVGLISWKISRVFNKLGSIKTNEVYIYKNQQAYLKGQKIIEKWYRITKVFIRNSLLKLKLQEE